MSEVTQLRTAAYRRAAEESRAGLLLSRDGAPKRSLANVMHTLATHPAWDGVLAYDEFGQAVVTTKVPPMRDTDAPGSYSLGDWSDVDSTRTVAWFASSIGFEPTVGHVDQAVEAAARKRIVHPVRDWLETLTWDGTPRLDAFVEDYLGGHRGEYSAAVGRRWLIAAVARVFGPGAKVDSMLVLEGVQGIGKSSALRMLAGAEWFADSGIHIGDKDSYQTLRRKWIYEFAELGAIKGARDIERVKNFLSSQCDTYRPSYGRRSADHPRQVVFAGSTNDSEYLMDRTGNRRFWPVDCRRVDVEALRRDREQIWAEARVAYEAGEPWHLDTPELRRLAEEEAARREEQDDWLPMVAKWLEEPTVPDLVHRDHRSRLDLDAGITTGDVLFGALGCDPARIQPRDTQRMGHVLRELGFARRQVRDGGSRVWRYFVTDPTNHETGDETGDTCGSPNSLVSPVTCEMRDTHMREGVESGCRVSTIANPPVTPVTGDSSEVGR